MGPQVDSMKQLSSHIRQIRDRDNNPHIYRYLPKPICATPEPLLWIVCGTNRKGPLKQKSKNSLYTPPPASRRLILPPNLRAGVGMLRVNQNTGESGRAFGYQQASIHAYQRTPDSPEVMSIFGKTWGFALWTVRLILAQWCNDEHSDVMMHTVM